MSDLSHIKKERKEETRWSERAWGIQQNITVTQMTNETCANVFSHSLPWGLMIQEEGSSFVKGKPRDTFNRLNSRRNVE